MWKRVLTFNFTLTLFRDETVDIFKMAESAFDKVKGAKRICKETEQQTVSNATGIHRERRRYLRAVLKEACTLFHDQPGLLGPKALLVFQDRFKKMKRKIWGKSKIGQNTCKNACKK